MGDAKAFHDNLRAYLRQYKDSPLWDNLMAILNDLRVKCKLKPLKEDEVLRDEEPGGPEGGG
jgi:hypothetical protein